MCICLVSGDRMNENYQFFMCDVAFGCDIIKLVKQNGLIIYNHSDILH